MKVNNETLSAALKKATALTTVARRAEVQTAFEKHGFVLGPDKTSVTDVRGDPSAAVKSLCDELCNSHPTAFLGLKRVFGEVGIKI